MRPSHYLPWVVIGLAAMAWELVAFFDTTDTAWTLSRVIWWVDANKVRLGGWVGTAMVVLWLHWFVGTPASVRREARRKRRR